MESCKLRTFMLLEIQLLLILSLSVQEHPGPNHENVIDLLAALNMSHQMSGVARLQSHGSMMYRIRPKAPYLTLPREYSHFLYSNLKGSMGVHLVGHQAVGSSATLFSLSSPSSPILQMISSTVNDTLHLDYQAEGGVASFHFPRRNPFSREDWVQLAVSLEHNRLTFFVECQEAVVIPIKSEEKINLELPQDVVVTLASTPGKRESKFSGHLKTAEISMKAYLRRPWHCDNVTDDLPPSQYTDTPNPNSRTDSSRMLRHGLSTSKPETSHNIQSDQLHRGVVLGPPGSPQGVKSVSQAQKDDRLKRLEKRLEEMAGMLDMIKAQNADLQSRVQYLEGCECVRQQCVWEGRELEDGHRWQTDLNTVCTCTSGKVTCQADIKVASLQMIIPLPDPCLSSPCQNGGVCFVLTLDPAGFHCSCPPNTKGPVCHRQLRQVSRTFQMFEACWVPKPGNSCEGVGPIQRRWAFNPSSGLCEDFLYCTGNSSNNFPSFNACRDQCMLGACCLRKPSLPTDHQNHSLNGYNISSENSTLGQYNHYNLEDETWYGNIDFNITELEVLKENLKREQEKTIVDCHEDPAFNYTCDYLTIMQCQALVKDKARETQVVSFYPGVKCSDVRCGGGCGCFSQRKLWRYGARFRQGCEKCECTHSGRVDCVCRHLTQRKEIRDLTLRERSLYQKAVRKLYTRPAVWKGFALLRAEYSPQVGDHAFFLPWHRYFLRLVERELQSLSSCKLAIPYFEWTVDSGSMQSSAAWQAGLFGGNGKPGSDCVQYHPFQDRTSRSHWSPCLRRSFNSSIWLPDAVTLQTVVNLADFQLFSQSLQTFSGLFRLWVGGLMASPLAAYDPLYLSHMAFIDKLWAQWQEKHQHGSDRETSKEDDTLYPTRQRHMKMKPFDVTPDDVISSEKQTCVIYVPITIGAPCNMTSLQTHTKRSLKNQKHSFAKHSSHHCSFVSEGFDSNGFDHDGYDREGYDQSGWDRWEFGKDGFNRDFIDRDGYDISGFNRYGFNHSNVSWFGMHWDEVFKKDKKENQETDGEDKNNQMVLTDKIMSEFFNDKGYSIYGFNHFSLDRGGFDAFGFRADGYDKDGCNWFFNGPHYLRFYFHTQQLLMSSSDQALNRIPRICPPITSLPKHWAIQDWMIHSPEESIAPNGEPEHDWVGQSKQESDDTVMAATHNRTTTWLPITPDHRFCFKLHWFSGCPLGSAPITCPDLCLQARCHGYPKAVCHMRNCGSCFTEWQDPATGNHVICHGW